MMTTLHSRVLNQPQGSNGRTLHGRQSIDDPPTAHELHEQLRACQRRLGTGDEVVGDFELARYLAHEINNRLTIEWLRAEMDAMTVSASSLAGGGADRLVG